MKWPKLVLTVSRKSYHPLVPQVKQPLIQKLCIIFCLPPTSISFFKQEPVYAQTWSKNSPRFHTILQSRDAGVKFLEVVIAFVVKEIKMPPRRRVVKRCRKNVIYFLLRFSPIAQCVNRFWRYNVSTSAQHASVVFSSKYKRDVTKTLSRFHYWEDVKTFTWQMLTPLIM